MLFVALSASTHVQVTHSPALGARPLRHRLRLPQQQQQQQWFVLTNELGRRLRRKSLTPPPTLLERSTKRLLGQNDVPIPAGANLSYVDHSTASCEPALETSGLLAALNRPSAAGGFTTSQGQAAISEQATAAAAWPVTLCLLSFRRPQNIGRILKGHARAHSVFAAAIVWNNNPDTPLVLSETLLASLPFPVR